MVPAPHPVDATAPNRLAWGLLLIVLFLPWHPLDGASVESTFNDANRLYEQERYPDAIEIYQSLLKQDVQTPALHFNLANALLRSGQTGQAIYHYRLAQQLAPRDPDVRANLDFARQSTNQPHPSASSGWQRAVLHLTLNEWTVLTMASFWACLALLALSQFKIRLRPALRPYMRFLAFCTLLSLVPLTAAWHLRHQPVAIVVVPESAVRFGPFSESQEHYTLKDGAELVILDQLNDWLQVRDPQGRVGWITTNQIARLRNP
jgi:hypothetical protein